MYTKVLDQDVKDYGSQIAYTLGKMRQLEKHNSKDGWFMMTHTFAIEHCGIVSHQTQWSRLIRKMRELGLIKSKMKVTQSGRVNHYQLVNKDDVEVVQESVPAKKRPERREIPKERIEEFTKAADRAAERGSQRMNPVQAFLKRVVIPQAIYRTMHEGSEVFVVSNGVDNPKMVNGRFKQLLNSTCQELELSSDVALINC